MPKQRFRDEKGTRFAIRVFLIAGCVPLVLGLLFLLLLPFGIYSEGSPELATEWRDEMVSWNSLSDAVRDSTISTYEFESGEWAIARSKSSHGGIWNGGGTVVIKDSTGEIQIFHEGHVCGDGNPLIFVEYDDLNSFYEAMKQSGFREFVIE